MAIKSDPHCPNGWNARGKVYFAMGQKRKAIGDYSKAIEVDPTFAMAWSNRAEIYLMDGEVDNSIADYSKAIKLDASEAGAWYRRGFAYGHLKQWDNAIVDFTKAIELEPANPAAWLGRAQSYRQLRQFDKAIDDYSHIVRSNPDVLSGERKTFARALIKTAWAERGTVYADLGRWDKAIGDYSRALELDPMLVEARLSRVLAYSRLGQWKMAISDCSERIDREPENAVFWRARGLFYHRTGDFESAIRDYSQAILLDPQFGGQWWQRGESFAKRGEWENAIADYGQAIAREPKNAGWQNGLAWLLATHADPKLRNAGRAVELARRAVALAPAEATYWNTLGTAYYRAGSWQEAVTALDKSMELGGGGITVDWLFLAMAHYQLGHKNEARRWYDLADEFYQEDQRRFHEEAAALLRVPPMRLRVAMLPQGREHARAMRWSQAATCYDKANMSVGVGRGNVAFERACYGLLMDDQEVFRSGFAAVLKPPDGVPAPRGFLVARFCTLAPVPPEDLARAEEMARKELQDNPRFWAVTASAGLHYRAGRYQQAVDLLHKCLKDYPTWDGRVLDWLWLAMAYHRLGKGAEARDWLKKAQQWFDKSPRQMPAATENGISWHLHDWLEAQVLRRDAETLIGGNKGHASK
jgi:tetratricopeptide (TPR) repeat protein